MKKTTLIICLGFLLVISALVIGQIVVKPSFELTNDCYIVQIPSESIEAIVEKQEVCNQSCTCGKNCGYTNVFKEYVTVKYMLNKTVCRQKVNQVDMLLEGFNCSSSTGSVVCDSCNDGNCDGKCSALGGETCCRVNLDGSTTCKNGVVEWKEAQILPVAKLVVSK